MGIPLAPQNGTYRLRILVVDDDEADRLAVRRCLHQSGLSVAIEEARTGAEALKLIAHSDYDCVFLDYYLPDVAGLSLLEKSSSRRARTSGGDFHRAGRRRYCRPVDEGRSSGLSAQSLDDA